MRIKLDQTGETLERYRSGGSMLLKNLSCRHTQSENLDVICANERHRPRALAIFG